MKVWYFLEENIMSGIFSRNASALVLSVLLHCPWAMAQGFDSGSDGSDGALALTEAGLILFDPSAFTPPLDPDGDGVYHFTTITIAEGVTVKLSANPRGVKPVIWLASGDVSIAGTVDLNGERGHASNAPRLPATGGAGGYSGGVGRSQFAGASRGNGPGGGLVSTRSGPSRGSSAGHALQGGAGDSVAGGKAYGNDFLLPLLQTC